MANASNSKNDSTKKAIVKANLKPNQKNTPPSSVEQPTTPTKDIPMATIIMPNKPQIEKTTNVDNLTYPMVLDPLQTSNQNQSNPTPNINSPSINPTPSLGKISSSCVDYFATCADVKSLVV